MGSVNDWAAKLARHLLSELDGVPKRLLPTESRLAAIIVIHAMPLLDMLHESRRGHGYDDEGDPCEKTNYLDGLHACTCGADAWNERLDKVLDGRNKS